MALANPKKGDIVSFQFVQNGIIGDQKNQVKVASVMDYVTARALDPEINVKHQALYTYFAGEVGNVNDPSAYDYIGIINTNGLLEVIGIPWILASTFRTVAARRATVVIDNYREEFKAPMETFFASLGANVTINIFDT